jgi:tetratricopeptide (TPR) repeat protein
MPDAERESKYLGMIKDFPESPLGFFSLGRYYLEERQFDEAAKRLDECTRLDPTFAAALVSLGDALAGGGKRELALDAYRRARAAALNQNHPELAEDIDQRVADLD